LQHGDPDRTPSDIAGAAKSIRVAESTLEGGMAGKFLRRQEV
jgi:hypothetical protein